MTCAICGDPTPFGHSKREHGVPLCDECDGYNDEDLPDPFAWARLLRDNPEALAAARTAYRLGGYLAVRQLDPGHKARSSP